MISNCTSTAFRVTADGVGPLTYQWLKDGEQLSDDGRIAGTHTDTLTVTHVEVTDAGDYSVQVSNECGGAISDPATLAVVSIAPNLIVDATCPFGGSIAVQWSHATPAGPVALVYARHQGDSVVPSSYPCAGTVLGLGPSQIRVVFRGDAGAFGERAVQGSAGSAACSAFLQLLDLTTCETSNVAMIE